VSSSDAPEKVVCAKCGREIADGQRVEHRGALYCAVCVGEVLNGALAPQPAPRHNVALAVILSFLPGLGQMYNRQMKKGLLVMGAFFFTTVMREEIGLGSAMGVITPTLYFWNLFDAYWTAKRIKRAGMPEPEVPPEEDWSLPLVERRWESATTPAFGVLLIVLGILFLLNNFGVGWLTYDRLWPAAILALGLWLLASFAFSRRGSAPLKSPSQETQDGEDS